MVDGSSKDWQTQYMYTPIESSLGTYSSSTQIVEPHPEEEGGRTQALRCCHGADKQKGRRRSPLEGEGGTLSFGRQWRVPTCIDISLLDRLSIRKSIAGGWARYLGGCLLATKTPRKVPSAGARRDPSYLFVPFFFLILLLFS
ncbi:hypothetical protein PMIN06_003581 [Paraphaeosphaeria minitans]